MKLFKKNPPYADTQLASHTAITDSLQKQRDKLTPDSDGQYRKTLAIFDSNIQTVQLTLEHMLHKNKVWLDRQSKKAGR